MTNTSNKMYYAKSVEWDSKAGVRSNPQDYNLNLSKENDKNGSAKSWHLDSYSAILSHDELSSLSEEDKEFVRGTQLLEFVTKQAVFEVDCVNFVANKLALGKYKYTLTENIRLDAFKVYTDEGYHAYYTQKIANQIRDHYGIGESDIDPYIKGYFEKIDKLVSQFGEQHTELCMLVLVIAAEAQIVSDISREMKQIVHEPIRVMFKDHMIDEAFHAQFFHLVFENVWPQLSAEEAEIMGKMFCDAMVILATPRVDIYYYSLAKLGIQKEVITRCISDTYHTQEWRTTRIKERMVPTVNLLRKNGVFENKKILNIFQDREFV